MQQYQPACATSHFVFAALQEASCGQGAVCEVFLFMAPHRPCLFVMAGWAASISRCRQQNCFCSLSDWGTQVGSSGVSMIGPSVLPPSCPAAYCVRILGSSSS